MDNLALATASMEELVHEITSRCEVAIIGLLLPAAGSGANGARETIVDIKETAPFQALGFSQELCDITMSWHVQALKGEDSPNYEED